MRQMQNVGQDVVENAEVLAENPGEHDSRQGERHHNGKQDSSLEGIDPSDLAVQQQIQEQRQQDEKGKEHNGVVSSVFQRYHKVSILKQLDVVRQAVENWFFGVNEIVLRKADSQGR